MRQNFIPSPLSVTPGSHSVGHMGVQRPTPIDKGVPYVAPRMTGQGQVQTHIEMPPVTPSRNAPVTVHPPTEYKSGRHTALVIPAFIAGYNPAWEEKAADSRVDPQTLRMQAQETALKTKGLRVVRPEPFANGEIVVGRRYKLHTEYVIVVEYNRVHGRWKCHRKNGDFTYATARELQST